MTNLLRATIVCLLFIGFLSKNVYALGVDIHTEIEKWNVGLSGDASGSVLGLGIAKHLNKNWQLGVGGSHGDFSIANQSATSLTRNTLDVVFVRRNRVAFIDKGFAQWFVGYQLMKIDYSNQQVTESSFDDTSHGMGGGVSAQYILNDHWMMFSRANLSTIYSRVEYRDRVDQDGFGLSYGIDLGVIYRFYSQTNIGIGFKSQANNMNYGGSAGKWNHDYNRWGLSVSRHF